jgi:STE24 endopeptidase
MVSHRYGIGSVLSCNQSIQAVLTKDPPEELKDHYTKEHIAKTRAYSIDKKNFGLLKGIFDFAENISLLYFVLLPVAWRLARRSLEAVRPAWADNEYAVSITFALLTALFETGKGVPWSMYFAFVIEARHGFNKQTLAIFFSDIIKSVCIFSSCPCCFTFWTLDMF